MFKKKTEEKLVLKVGSRSEEMVNCGQCQKELTVGERHAFRGNKGQDVYLCDECLKKVNEVLEQETKNPKLITGLLGGILAGIIGGVLWYFITITTEREIGYLGIGLGWLIGMGVYYGAGKKKGGKLQLIAGLVTIVSLLISELMIMIHFMVKYAEAEVAETEVFWRILTSTDGAAQIDLLDIFVKNMISPIGLLIWGLGVYTAFRTLQARKI